VQQRNGHWFNHLHRPHPLSEPPIAFPAKHPKHAKTRAELSVCEARWLHPASECRPQRTQGFEVAGLSMFSVIGGLVEPRENRQLCSGVATATHPPFLFKEQASKMGIAPWPMPTPGALHRLAGASPEPRRSTSDRQSEVLRRGSGEVPARFACGTGEDRYYPESSLEPAFLIQAAAKGGLGQSSAMNPP
jgi:hypothetical protein